MRNDWLAGLWTLGLLAILGCVEAHPASAQQATIVTSCGAQSLVAGRSSGPYMDVSGNSCTNAQTTISSVTVTSSALPTGAATSANQATEITALTTLSGAVGSAIPAQSSHGINIGGIEGVAASGASDTDNPLNNGCRAATAAPTAVTDGQKVAALCGTEGKNINLPYSIKELAVRGTVTSTDTNAHTIIASAGGSLKNYITGLQCGRTDAGATAIVLTLSDAASTVVILPSGGATNIQFAIPLVTAAATAFTVTSGTGVSTLYCSAQGYTGL